MLVNVLMWSFKQSCLYADSRMQFKCVKIPKDAKYLWCVSSRTQRLID